MSDESKFRLDGTLLTVTAPFLFDDRQADEEAFLAAVDKLLAQRGAAVSIDLVHAGGVSSTVLALLIAAARKAADAKKSLSVRLARRNAMIVRVANLDKVLDIQFA